MFTLFKWNVAWFYNATYVSITLCFGLIVCCLFDASPPGKGGFCEPPTPLGNFCLEPPLPLGISIDLVWGVGSMDIFWNHTLHIFQTFARYGFNNSYFPVRREKLIRRRDWAWDWRFWLTGARLTPKAWKLADTGIYCMGECHGCIGHVLLHVRVHRCLTYLWATNKKKTRNLADYNWVVLKSEALINESFPKVFTWLF